MTDAPLPADVGIRRGATPTAVSVESCDNVVPAMTRTWSVDPVGA